MIHKIIMRYAQKTLEANGIVAVNGKELDSLLNKIKSAIRDVHRLKDFLDDEAFDRAGKIEEDLFYAVDYAELVLFRK